MGDTASARASGLLARLRGPAAPLAGPRWGTLPAAARLYVAAVIGAGAGALIASCPRSFPHPVLFTVLLAFSCVTSTWKVNLPIPVANGSTLSVSYAANLMSLLLLGPRHAVITAVAGVWTQCRYRPKERYPIYRTLFSAAGAVLTMLATGAVYASLGGPTAPLNSLNLAKPLVGAIATYFIVNTTLVAAAIALSTHRNLFTTWHRDFLWSGASFMVAGTAGALAAIVVDRGDYWKAVLLIAPIYLTYRTYELFVGRLEDQKRHMTELRRFHEGTVTALAQAREAERALADEKQRLASALAQMTALEEARNQLLVREQAARASAEEANRLKDQFLAVVSHELRTPLSAILGWADLIRRRKLDGEVRDRALRSIYESARRQAQLIEDLLDIARIMSGTLRLQRSLVDIEDTVRDALQVVQPTAVAKGIRISVEAEGGLPPIYGDGARLQQIVWNLLSNAVKFTPKDGLITVKLKRIGEDAALIVRDTGQGISSEFLPSVFEPFRQADGSTTRVHHGLGLGLSIVNHLVEAHGGRITAESEGEGRGATFTVRLPLAQRKQLRAAPPSKSALSSSFDADEPLTSLEGLSVLVVDDDGESRDVVAAHLEQCHAAVLTAASAAQAMDVLAHERVDVLLADIGMPEEDGYSLIRRVRERQARCASVPAAALTAFARDEDRREALRAGFQMHLPKPIDGRSLVEAVAALGRMNPAPMH